jgi:hypothetical protein
MMGTRNFRSIKKHWVCFVALLNVALDQNNVLFVFLTRSRCASLLNLICMNVLIFLFFLLTILTRTSVEKQSFLHAYVELYMLLANRKP